MEKSEVFSPCGKYRYQLYRIWDRTKPLVLYIGLNPSYKRTNGTESPTIYKMIEIAKQNGYGGFYICNVYPQITANPKYLIREIIPENIDWIHKTAKFCVNVIFCWGNHFISSLDNYLSSYFPFAKVIERNKNGSPKHPLYANPKSKLTNYY